MKNLNDWGFIIKEKNEEYITYKQKSNNSENFMYLYKIIDGVYIYDIHLGKPYFSHDIKNIYKSGYRISYCKEGTYTSNINGHKIFISTGEVFIGKSVTYAIESKTLVGKNRAFNILISPHEIKYDACERDFFNFKGILATCLANLSQLQQLGFSTIDLVIVNCADEIIRALDSKNYDYIKLKVFEILYLSSKINLKNQQKRYIKCEKNLEKKARDIEKFICENYQYKLTIGDLCKKFDISKNSLNNCFRTLFQYSPQKYLLNVRMLKAQELLIKSNYNITKIALLVGFDNSSNFARSFRRFSLTSPAKYREQYKGL